jgi:uncharacterized lipoprotein YmbA
MTARQPLRTAAGPSQGRRHCLVAGGWALAAGSAGALAACGTSPPTRLYELRLEPQQGAEQPQAPGNTLAGGVWELSPRVALPAALDRDTLQVASGAAGLQPLEGHRWAAPLRDAVPRLLLHDLQRLRGPGRVWQAPVPAGVQPTQRLRVELLQLLASADRRTLQLQAQWWWQALADRALPPAPLPGASAPPPALLPAAPRAVHATLQLALADTSVDTLAAGHRQLLWQLAQRVVASAADPA